MDKIILSMTRKRALELGLLTCANCDFPENNHFERGSGSHGKGACAHDSSCRAYDEVGISGVVLVSETP